MTNKVTFNLKPLTLQDLPEVGTPEWAAFLDERFQAGQEFVATMDDWTKQSNKAGDVQIVSLNSGKLRNSLGVNEYWCGRVSHHSVESVRKGMENPKENGFALNPVTMVRTMSKRLSIKGKEDMESKKAQRPHEERRATFELDDVERQERFMNSTPQGLYESFRRGLLEYHSENEREYIEACRETACLEVLQPHVAEIWKMTYVTPAPASPRTFVTLLLSRELKSTPHGARSFMNISIPFVHASCPEKTGEEKSKVRGKYVSVELVTELEDGSVDWRMATSSDAGGSIPRFITNSTLPKSIAEDVPSFLSWMWKRFPVQENAVQANN